MSSPVLTQTPLDKIAEFERRLAALERRPKPTGIPAGNVSAGTFSGAFTFANDLTVNGTITDQGVTIRGTAGRNYFKDSELSTGLGLRVGAAWSKYGIYSESGDLALGAATGRVTFQGAGDGLARLDGGAWYVGSGVMRMYPTDTTYVEHKHVSSSRYQLLMRDTGLTILDTGATDPRILLRSNGSGRITIDASVTTHTAHYCDEWFRSNTSGLGWYHQIGGGGWFMSDTTYMRVYNNKQVYTATKVRGGNAAIAGSAAYGSTFATFGVEGIGDGSGYCAMQGSDGTSYYGHAAATWSYFRDNNQNCFQYQRSGSATDFRFVGGGLPALAGNTAIYATGSGQIGYSSSSRRFKTEVGPLLKATDPGLNKPIAEHQSPVWGWRPLRYRWNEQVANHEDANAPYPDGIAGFFAEEIEESGAADAVQQAPDGTITGLDTNAMLAYIVGALQHVHDGGHRRLEWLKKLDPRVAALEPKVDDLLRRLAVVEAVPAVRAALPGKGK